MSRTVPSIVCSCLSQPSLERSSASTTTSTASATSTAPPMTTKTIQSSMPMCKTSKRSSLSRFLLRKSMSYSTKSVSKSGHDASLPLVLRKPQLHRPLPLPNGGGFSCLLSPSAWGCAVYSFRQLWRYSLQSTLQSPSAGLQGGKSPENERRAKIILAEYDEFLYTSSPIVMHR